MGRKHYSLFTEGTHWIQKSISSGENHETPTHQPSYLFQHSITLFLAQKILLKSLVWDVVGNYVYVEVIEKRDGKQPANTLLCVWYPSLPTLPLPMETGMRLGCSSLCTWDNLTAASRCHPMAVMCFGCHTVPGMGQEIRFLANLLLLPCILFFPH